MCPRNKIYIRSVHKNIIIDNYSENFSRSDIIIIIQTNQMKYFYYQLVVLSGSRGLYRGFYTYTIIIIIGARGTRNEQLGTRAIMRLGNN